MDCNDCRQTGRKQRVADPRLRWGYRFFHASPYLDMAAYAGVWLYCFYIIAQTIQIHSNDCTFAWINCHLRFLPERITWYYDLCSYTGLILFFLL